MANEGGACFSIGGWNGPNATQFLAESRAQIDFARRICAREVAQLETRLAPLEAGLEPGSKAHAKFVATKDRPHFEISVEAVKADRRSIAASIDRSYFENADRLVPERVGMSSALWLSHRFPGHGSSLIIGALDADVSQAIEATGFIVQKVAAGAGKPQPSPLGHRERHRPGAKSFASFFASIDGIARASISFFALGSDAGPLDVRLLQSRLSAHHVIIVDRSLPARDLLLKTWDGKAYELDDSLLLVDPGPRYLEPTQGGGSHIPDAVWPKISVVTVSYNQGRYLEDCLESVLSQGYPNLEYLVVDAVSNDGSVEILKRYEPRLAKLVIEKDNGQSDGLNKGFRLATGDILTWVNSDDMLAPGALKIAALTFMQHDCDLVAGACERITEDSDEVTLLHHPALPFMETVALGFAENLVWRNSWEKGDYFFQPEVVFTADIWRRSGGYLKEHLYWAMDWELWIRMAMAGASIVHVPDRIGRSREHAEQKTTSAELYLFQLKNILLEHDEALARVQLAASMLPRGKTPTWYDRTEIQNPAAGPSLMARIAGLRDPAKLKAAIRHRLKPHQVERIKRFRRRRAQMGLVAALRAGLPAEKLSNVLARLGQSESDLRKAQSELDRLRDENAHLKQHHINVSKGQAVLFDRLVEVETLRVDMASIIEERTRTEVAEQVAALNAEVVRLQACLDQALQGVAGS